MLRVVSERRVRGTVERTYALRLERSRLSAGELAGLSREDHLQTFMSFLAGLLADYERYLADREPDLERDGVSYSMNAVWLSDEEYAAFLRDVVSIVEPRTKLTAGPGRSRRLIASVFMPLPTGHPDNQAENGVDHD